MSILEELYRRGIDVRLMGNDRIGVSPKDKLTPELISHLKKNKAKIIKALQRPHIDRRGILVVPLECDDKYKWWAGGQSVQKTLKEIGAPPEVIAKYTDGGTA